MVARPLGARLRNHEQGELRLRGAAQQHLRARVEQEDIGAGGTTRLPAAEHTTSGDTAQFVLLPFSILSVDLFFSVFASVISMEPKNQTDETDTELVGFRFYVKAIGC
jgi:hypothetical protein